MSKIYLGTDHAGFELKELVKVHLKAQGLEVEDEGAFTSDPEDDYTDYVKIVAKMVQGNPGSRGIVFGGSGQGEAICANRFKGVRAALYYGGPEDIVTLSRNHNDANILSLGARFITFDQAQKAIDQWLITPFSGEEKHARRVAEIDQIDHVGHVI